MQFRSALIAICGSFLGRFDPYRSIQLEPRDGGVMASATDGSTAVWVYDPSGLDEEESAFTIVPSGDLLKASKDIKSARRLALVGSRKEDGDPKILNLHKTSSKITPIEKGILIRDAPFPPLTDVANKVVERWSSFPSAAATAGRYDLKLMKRLLDSIDSDSVVLSAFDGGPMRIQRETDDIQVVALLMPQTAEPLPSIPSWLADSKP